MGAPRGEFSSKLGFLMAAAGSAVGLGNVISFPSQVASNGGAAFLLLYLLLAFCLAYPALMAELVIGRHAKANSVEAMRKIAIGPISIRIGVATGFGGMLVASLILSFYVIIAGWMLAHVSSIGHWSRRPCQHDGVANDERCIAQPRIFGAVLMVISVAIICGGVKEGIEKWCSRLMPALLVILVLLIVYVLTLDGAMEGLRGVSRAGLQPRNEPTARHQRDGPSLLLAVVGCRHDADLRILRQRRGQSHFAGPLGDAPRYQYRRHGRYAHHARSCMLRRLLA